MSANSADTNYEQFESTSRTAIAAFLLAAHLIGQSTTSVHGEIADSGGALVPGAVVTVTNPTDAFSRQTTSDGTGQYQFPQMPPGDYDLSVEQQGFRVATQSKVRLQVNTPATINFKLELGNVTETVNVSAEAPR